MGHFNERNFDSTFNDRIDRARLRTDPEYLTKVACEQFKQNDRYHRGLLTAQAFSRSLEDLGLRYGSKEVDEILQFCTITDDGYVHYKDLIAHFAPQVPRAKQTSMKSTIFPEEEEVDYGSMAGASCQESAQTSVVSSRQRMFLAERTDDIRQAYARWDRGMYTNESFKTELRGFGLQLTKELERLLEVHNGSRNMSFGQLMAALQIDEVDGRRARGQYLGSEPDASSGYCVASQGPREHQSICSSSVTAATRDIQSPLRQAICDFVDGRIPGIAFRRQLRQGGVPVPPELDRLIRSHEQASSVTFQEFAKAVLRQDKEDHMNGSVTPSYMSSVPQTPSGVSRGAPFAVGGNYERPSRVPTESGSAHSGGQFSTSMRSSARPPLRAPYANDDYPPPTPSDAASRSGRSTPAEFPVFRPPSEVSRSDSASGARRSYSGSAPQARQAWEEKQPSTGSTPRRKDRNDHQDRDGRSRLLDDRERDSASGARTPPPQHRGIPNTAQRSSRDMADCLSWPTERESSKPEAGRPGKRYGDRGAAQEILPWAAPSEDPDHNRRKPSQHGNAAPFGTDADMHHRRPEDAGSAEYLPANQVNPRNRPF